MPRYDDDLFSPAAPIAYVTLRAPDNSATVDNVPMLIDSGADAALLPKAFVDRKKVDGSGAAARVEAAIGRWA